MKNIDISGLPQYRLMEKRQLHDIHSEGYLLEHIRSGLRVLCIANDDDNKVFTIGFRTTPQDDTGVAHILEHSVLCGSEKFPLKDPFIQLYKGSLNTFLNAITYPDKTVYPVASQNEKDFRNLMDVYMDAVFHPNIYHIPEIFRQEGWGYELEMTETGEERLRYNGVVFNEMKGALGSAEDVTDRLAMQALFPGTTYACESGGDPVSIPDLTYEQFLEFHKRFYHPSNGYLYLYGDMDFVKELTWMDEAYLSDFEAQTVDTRIPYVTPQEAILRIGEYGIAADEEVERKTALSYHRLIGDSRDMELMTDFSLLSYALVGAQGAHLKQALLDAGFAKDIVSDFSTSTQQAVFSIMAKGAEEADLDRFTSLLRSTLEDLCQSGLNHELILAGLNHQRFQYLEADFGNCPKGLIYGLSCMGIWMYDGDPFSHVEQLRYMEMVPKKLAEGYYEQMIRTYLLQEDHGVVVVAKPKRGLLTALEEAEAQKLAGVLQSLSETEKTVIREEQKRLLAFQNREDSDEVKRSIPLLSREEIERRRDKIANELLSFNGGIFLYHPIETDGIIYLDLLFDADICPQEELGLLGLLPTVLGAMDTAHYRYQDLSNQVNIYTGGMSTSVVGYTVRELANGGRRFLKLSVKCMKEDFKRAFGLMTEVLNETLIKDEKRMQELLSKLVTKLSEHLISGGMTAMNRANSYMNLFGQLTDRIKGLDFYEYVKELEGSAEKRGEAMQTMQSLLQRLVRKNRVLISLTTDETAVAGVRTAVEAWVTGLPDGEPLRQYQPVSRETGEGIKCASQVQYNAMVGDYQACGLPYHGSLQVVGTILGTEYLWDEVRINGKAYGCHCGFSRSGECYLSSYRDPQLTGTYEIYRRIPAYLRNLQLTEEELTRFIIGTISSVDTPMNPSAQGNFSLFAYLTGLTNEEIALGRQQILDTTEADIHRMADYVEAVLEQNYYCTVGAESRIEQEKDFFRSVLTIQV
ncbi:MAG: insulinase family protein [Lachnospiraceae bacterium]|nr:insulinase family protein [Lachnospiraceae bacterium]